MYWSRQLFFAETVANNLKCAEKELRREIERGRAGRGREREERIDFEDKKDVDVVVDNNSNANTNGSQRQCEDTGEGISEEGCGCRCGCVLVCEEAFRCVSVLSQLRSQVVHHYLTTSLQQFTIYTI